MEFHVCILVCLLKFIVIDFYSSALFDFFKLRFTFVIYLSSLNLSHQMDPLLENREKPDFLLAEMANLDRDPRDPESSL